MAFLLVCSLGCTTTANTGAEADEIRALEQQWNEAIDRRDAAAMERFLAPDYALIIGVRGQPLRVVPRDVWLKTLALYDIRSFSIDDFRVSIRGDVAVVTMLFTQDAVVGPERRDRSAQFMITDIWVRYAGGWRVAERHSSRPEQPVAAQ